MIPTFSRRKFLGLLAASAVMPAAIRRRPVAAAVPAGPIKRVAAINTVCHIRSHAYPIAGRFIFGYPIDGFHHQPEFKLVRMYNDQYAANDLSRGLAAKHGFEISKTVAEALGGERGFDIDAVLLIGEHGSYPSNEIGQILYPRHKLFMEIAGFARAWNIEKLFATGKSPYPVERTLLTTTVLDFAMRSPAAGGKRIEDRAMEVAYAPPADSGYMRGRYTDD